MSTGNEDDVQQLKQRLAEKERETCSLKEKMDAAKSQIRSIQLELDIVNGHLTIAKASKDIAKTKKRMAEKQLEAMVQEFDAYKKDIKNKITALLNDLWLPVTRSVRI